MSRIRGGGEKKEAEGKMEAKDRKAEKGDGKRLVGLQEGRGEKRAREAGGGGGRRRI